MYGAGFYSYSILALIFWETRRSDFGISMTHHAASLSLIVLSYIFRCDFIVLNVFTFRKLSLSMEIGFKSTF